VTLIFSCSQWEVGTREHRPITEKGISTLVSNFNEANKRWIIVKGSEKAFERSWKPSAHTHKVLIKMFRPSKKYPFRGTVPLTSSKLKHKYLFRRCVCLAGQHGQTSVCLQVRIYLVTVIYFFYLSIGGFFWCYVPLEVLYILFLRNPSVILSPA